MLHRAETHDVTSIIKKIIMKNKILRSDTTDIFAINKNVQIKKTKLKRIVTTYEVLVFSILFNTQTYK